MKIVHIMLCGIVTDGWNYQDNLLTKYHAKNGHEVTMITSRWVWNNKGQFEIYDRSEYINEDNVKVIRLPIKFDKPFRSKFKRYKGLYESIESENPDILFVHGVSFLDVDVVVKYLEKNENVKVYVDNHSDFSNSATNWLSKNILHKILWRHTAHIIEPYTTKFYGVLPARVDFLKNVYKLPPEKCELLVMGADDEKVEEARESAVREEIRSRYGIKEDDFFIITGGKIDPWKTQTLLLMEAVAKIDDPRVKLIVFGSVTPDLKEKVETLCVADKVQYIGWVESQKSYKYFAAADLVAFPGRHSVFWEQVAGLGIPMLCKYWEGTTHVDLGGNVEFLQEDSADEIYRKIVDIATTPGKYEKMKAVAEGKNMEVFSYENIARRCIS